MRIAVDTNVLVRAATEDDPRQTKLAQTTMGKAELVAVSTAALWELVGVLTQGYKAPREAVAVAIRRLLNSPNVVANRPAVENGLSCLGRGGDFADGAIAFEGRWLGA